MFQTVFTYIYLEKEILNPESADVETLLEEF